MATKKLTGATAGAAEVQPWTPPQDLYGLVSMMKRLSEVDTLEESELAEFDRICRDLLQGTKDKLDGLHYVMLKLSAQAAIARGASNGAAIVVVEEDERLTNRALRFERQLARMTNLVLEVMVMRGVYVDGKPAPLEGNRCTFQANKMPDRIEESSYDETLVPRSFQKVTLTWNGTANDFGKIMPQAGTAYAIEATACKVVYTVDKVALLAALKEDCPECKGKGEVEVKAAEDMSAEALECGADSELVNCFTCKGSGKRKIAGAKLETGRLKLVVK